MAHLKKMNYCRLYHILTYRLFQNCICHKFRICNTYLLSPPILSPGIPSSHDYIYTFLWIDTRVPPLKKGTVSHIFLVFRLWASKTKIDLDKNLLQYYFNRDWYGVYISYLQRRTCLFRPLSFCFFLGGSLTFSPSLTSLALSFVIFFRCSTVCFGRYSSTILFLWSRSRYLIKYTVRKCQAKQWL